MNRKVEAMKDASQRRYVQIAPPPVYAGLGNALRQAYAPVLDDRSANPFAELLARLN